MAWGMGDKNRVTNNKLLLPNDSLIMCAVKNETAAAPRTFRFVRRLL